MHSRGHSALSYLGSWSAFELPLKTLGRQPNPHRRMGKAELEGEAPTSFFLILHKLYSRILTSLQVAVDHLAEPETALQDLTTLHNQAH